MAAVVTTLARGIRAAGRAMGWSTLGGSRHRNDAEILELLGSNSRLGSPVDAIATDVSMVTWTVKKRSKVKGEESWIEVGTLGDGRNLSNDPLVEALNNPTGRLSWSAWIYVLTVYRLAVGYAPIWAEEDEAGRLARLQPVAPHNVSERRPKQLPSGELVWRVIEDGIEVPVPMMDLLWAFRVDPKDPKGPGLGKARGIEDDLSADEAMSQFNSMYFKNGAVLGPVVNIPGADLDTLEKEWQQERRGLINAHRPLLTNSEQPIQVSNTAPTMKDLAMPEGRKLGRDFILQAFHVSGVRLGMLDNATRAGIEGSDFHQQKHCTLPELIFWREFLNRHVVARWFGPDYYLDFKNPVKETAEFYRELADTGIRGGWIMVNEARKMHNLPEISGGNMLLIPVNNVIMLDASNGISVPDIATQLRMNGGQQVAPDKPKAVDALINSLKQLLQEAEDKSQ